MGCFPRTYKLYENLKGIMSDVVLITVRIGLISLPATVNESTLLPLKGTGESDGKNNLTVLKVLPQFLQVLEGYSQISRSLRLAAITTRSLDHLS